MNETEALLSQLRDVEIPTVSSGIAPGWWLLLCFVLVVCVLLYFRYKRWESRLWQRQATHALDGIRQQLGVVSSGTTLSSCSTLARKVVLAVDKRENVARLHGEAWLEKLDSVCARPEFTQGIGRLLVDQAYQKQPEISAADLSELLDSMGVLITSAGKFKPQNASVLTDKNAQAEAG